MEADAGLVLTPESAPSSERDPEEDARALAEFAALHGPALRASGVPERYWGRLLHKLEHEVRAGATWGGQGAGPGGPGCRWGPGHVVGGPLWTLLPGRVWSAGEPLAENCWGAAAGAGGLGPPEEAKEASWRTRADEFGRESRSSPFESVSQGGGSCAQWGRLQ